jgi:hypothetical protein
MTSLILYGLLSLLGTFLLTIIACLVILPICANARFTPFERLGQATYVLTIAGLLILYVITGAIFYQAILPTKANISYTATGQTQVLYDAKSGPTEKLTLTYRGVYPKSNLGTTGQTLQDKPFDTFNNLVIIKRDKNKTTIDANMDKDDIIVNNEKTKTATNQVITRVEITPVERTEKAHLFGFTIAKAKDKIKKVKVITSYQESQTTNLDNAFNN